jgi:peptidoglycan hydrolase-like protein with peptidoglycan-binding domain
MIQLIAVMGGVWLVSKLFQQSGGSITLPPMIHPSATSQAVLPKMTPLAVTPVSSGSSIVSDIQKMLNALGYTPKLAVDGAMGPKTSAAIKAFQTSQGMTVDGQATPAFKTTLANTVGPIFWRK